MILTLLKVIFESSRSKLDLHLVSCYINALAAASYLMLWTGFSPIVPDINSCLYIPQRWLLYFFTAPAIIHILSQISNYSTRMRIWVVLLNAFMLAAGGFGTVPWISWTHKVFWYTLACVPFPSILCHMWRMVTHALDETQDPSSKRAISFIRVFSITTWNFFPIVYFAAIDGALPLEISEPLWAALDWLTKMVYSSSLMEANFFTTHWRELTLRAIEEANRLATIQQLSLDIERKDEFLSAMSHELRTPLNGIIGLSDSMIAGACGNLPDKAVKTISTVKLSGKRLLQLINDILDAAKMKQGMLVIKHEKVDIRRLVSDVLDLSLPLVRKGVRLINNVGNVPKIVGDNGRIVQILYNLVGNAAKFTRAGTISVSAGVVEGKVYITVSDTGVGIPPDKIDKIFEAFEQVDMSTTRRFGGTGLGLHLVKELVKAHSGRISVQSKVGVGSSFTVWLPINQDESDLADSYMPSRPRQASEDSIDGGLAARPVGSSVKWMDTSVHTGAGAAGDTAATTAAAQAAAAARTFNKEVGANNMGAGAAALEGDSDDAAIVAAALEAERRAGGRSPPPMEASRNMPEDAQTLLSVTKSGFKLVKPFYRERNGGCMVLSVDDDPINQLVVENLLLPEGFKVEQAMCGSEALDWLQHTPLLPDVILLDIMMPDMSGYEVCQEVRRRFSTVCIPILMVSANGTPEHVMKGLEAGAVDYVKKPFNRQELLSRIRAQVRNREVVDAEMETRLVNKMLHRLLPAPVVEALQGGAGVNGFVELHEDVTLLAADVGSWLNTSGLMMSADGCRALLAVVNEMHAAFDKLLLKYKAFRVVSTLDHYLVVCGHDGTPDHVRRGLSLAEELVTAARSLTLPPGCGGGQLRVRCGLHTGPLTSVVVGVDTPHYAVFGETVGVVAALVSRGFDNTVHCSFTVHAALRLKSQDRISASFVPAHLALKLPGKLPAVQTYLYKCGDWEQALRQLDEEEGDRETVESAMAELAARERKWQEEQVAAEAAAELTAASLEEERAALEALAARLTTEKAELDGARAEVARLRSEMEAARAGGAAASASAARAAAEADVALAAARAEVETLTARLAESEAERSRIKITYEARLIEARETAAAAAASAHRSMLPMRGYATNEYMHGPPPGDSPRQQMLLAQHHQQQAQAQRARPAVVSRASASSDIGAPGVGSPPAPPVPQPSGAAAGGYAQYPYSYGRRGPPSVGGASSMNMSGGSFWTQPYRIESFMRDIGLPQYAAVLRRQDVTPAVLAGMRESDLEAMGVPTLGARLRILEAARQYGSQSTVRMALLCKDGQDGADGSEQVLSDAMGQGGVEGTATWAHMGGGDSEDAAGGGTGSGNERL
ncbi:hypothetical protein HXX76_003625 [Chlamydomonas incerta]|uniref:histidine kinase n=1 Tax=Chlamydomonas incerta TaxID=51695 RepID=A0A835T8I1_CHLIN|nr:hypothetical protein HXX76_003625 [Chlamydomonas incerta]|eukprot:KAG2440769.1 hypothetical protein HXX76_003625 [Chlamydomonas incerta]